MPKLEPNTCLGRIYNKKPRSMLSSNKIIFRQASRERRLCRSCPTCSKLLSYLTSIQNTECDEREEYEDEQEEIELSQKLLGSEISTQRENIARLIKPRTSAECKVKNRVYRETGTQTSQNSSKTAYDQYIDSLFQTPRSESTDIMDDSPSNSMESFKTTLESMKNTLETIVGFLKIQQDQLNAQSACINELRASKNLNSRSLENLSKRAQEEYIGKFRTSVPVPLLGNIKPKQYDLETKPQRPLNLLQMNPFINAACDPNYLLVNDMMSSYGKMASYMNAGSNGNNF